MAHVIGDPVRYTPVTRPYRRWLAWALALLLHLIVIGLVTSRQFAPAPPERTSLDVVLVTRPAEAPVVAEAIAEADQQAAGEQQSASDVDPATPAESSFSTPAEGSFSTPAEGSAETDAPPEPRESAPQAADSPSQPSAAAPSASGRDLLAQATRSIREQGLAPDSPGPVGDGRQQAGRRAAEARYIDDWTRRVEDYGNRVHPAPRHLHGQLRIRVVIGRDGGLRQAEVVQSSGHAELDQAALDTVHGAAPYRPFDPGMGDLDSLSITRVWRFGQGNHYGVD